MKLKLPQLIETLVQATNESDVKKYLSCFSKSATILDEGETLSATRLSVSGSRK